MGLILFPIVLLYVILVIWGTINTVSRQESPRKRVLFAFLIPIVFLLGPFADEFIARPYFYYLCGKESGVRVNQIVELDSKYFNENNELIFLDEADEIEPFNVMDVYYVREPLEKYSSIFNIKRRKLYFIDKRTDKILSENNVFIYHGGYLLHAYGKCHDSFSNEKRKLIEATFKLKT